MRHQDREASESELARWKDGPYPRYRDEVNSSIRFTGLTVDFFTEGKARYLDDLIRRHFPANHPRDCLDIGCGEGSMHRYLKDSVTHLHGIDVSEEAIKTAASANPWCRYSQFDGDRLPFEEGSFDVTFASCVVHHVAVIDRQQFFQEAYRVVRPGGLVVLFEHNPLNPLTRLAVFRCEFDRDATLLGRRESIRLICEAGFIHLESKYIFFVPLRAPWADRLNNALGRLALGAQYYVAGARPATT